MNKVLNDACFKGLKKGDPAVLVGPFLKVMDEFDVGIHAGL